MCSIAAIFSLEEMLIKSKKVSILNNIIRKMEKNWKIKAGANLGTKLVWSMFYFGKCWQKSGMVTLK